MNANANAQGGIAGPLRALAPAKINLGLAVGALREDGRHELVTVMQSISLADELILEPAAGEQDELSCPALDTAAERNLAALALKAFRAATGWKAPALRLRIEKRIPVAAGLGGGSADAAATLRLARAASGLGDEALLMSLAKELGADVPAQLRPGRWLAGGAGELLTQLPAPRGALEVLILPAARGLSTAAVYAQADRIAKLRPRGELEAYRQALRDELGDGRPLPSARLLINDLQQATSSLRPALKDSLALLDELGADTALISGSGPTVLGLFAGRDSGQRASCALRALADRSPAALLAGPVSAEFGAVSSLPLRHNCTAHE